MRRAWIDVSVILIVCIVCGVWAQAESVAYCRNGEGETIIRGTVQNQDLRRVGQVVVEVKDQEGNVVATAVSNAAGEYAVSVPVQGTYSVSAVQDTFRSEYVVLMIGRDDPGPVTLTLSQTREIALEVVSPLAPIQYKASSETYSVSRKDIESLPKGNNNDLHDVLLTIPSAAYGSLKQVHIRQDHANLQLRIDGVPIPETVSSTFSDVISPRAWERADIVLGGMEANVGNKTAALIDVTTKSGTKPAFGSLQMFGGSNQTVNPSFEYGGTIGEKFRFYILNSHMATNRGIEPPTLGHSIFHGQSERNQTFIRGDYQRDNTNNFSWVFLNSVAKYQIPTRPGLELDPSGQALPLLQASAAGVHGGGALSGDRRKSKREEPVCAYGLAARCLVESVLQSGGLLPAYPCHVQDRSVQCAGLLAEITGALAPPIKIAWPIPAGCGSTTPMSIAKST